MYSCRVRVVFRYSTQAITLLLAYHYDTISVLIAAYSPNLLTYAMAERWYILWLAQEILIYLKRV